MNKDISQQPVELSVAGHWCKYFRKKKERRKDCTQPVINTDFWVKENQSHSFPWKNHLSPWERANCFIPDQSSSPTGTLLPTCFSGNLSLEAALPALEIQFSANSKNHVLMLPPGIPSYFCTTEATVRKSWRIWKVALFHFVSQLTSADILNSTTSFPLLQAADPRKIPPGSHQWTSIESLEWTHWSFVCPHNMELSQLSLLTLNPSIGFPPSPRLSLTSLHCEPPLLTRV